ncbi:hypothetical protein FO519_004939 [Halicephalobus sp. NKZ332]|nr:hypothetical protein FO519_004939 [Halicephalobus sp. NKZ332]
MVGYLSFVTFFILVSIGHLKAEYSDSFAREVAYPLAVDAYDKNIENCIGKTLGNFSFGGQFTVQCDDSGDTCSAFVVAHPPTNTVAIVFRGSTSDKEITQEINSTLQYPMVSFIGDSYVTCEESESSKCSDQVLIPDYGDHGEYYGVKNYGNPNCVPPGQSCDQRENKH